MAEPSEQISAFWDNPIIKGLLLGSNAIQAMQGGSTGPLIEGGLPIWNAVGGWFGELRDWLNQLDEGGEEYLLNAMSTAMQRLNIPLEVVNDFKAVIKDYSPDVFPWRMMTALPIVLSAVSKVLSEPAGVLSILAERGFAKKTRHTYGTIADVQQFRWLTGSDTAFADKVAELGWGDDWQGLYNEILMRRLDPKEAVEYFRRDGWNMEDFDKYIKKLGYRDSEDRHRLLQLMYNNADLNSVQELRRREWFNDEQYKTYLERLGFKDIEVNMFDELKHRLLDPTVMVANWRRGFYDENDLRSMLRTHGYNDADTESLLTASYRPLDPLELRDMLRRKIIDPAFYNRGLLANGYHPDVLANMQELKWEVPTPSDLVRFGVREVFQPEIYKHFGQDQQFPEAIVPWGEKTGLSREVLMMYWIAHWVLPSPTQFYTMYHRKIIDYETLIKGMKAADYMPYFQDKMIQISYQQIPRRAINTSLREGIIDAEDAYEAYTRLGYDPVSAGIMSKLAVREATTDLRVLTKSEVLRAYLNDDYDLKQTKNALSVLDYTPDAIAFYIAEQDRKKLQREIAAQGTADLDVAEEAKDLTRSQLLKGFRDGLITRKEVEPHLTSLGYSAAAIEYMVQQQIITQALDDLEFIAEQIRKRFLAGIIDGIAVQSQLVAGGLAVEQAQRYVLRWTAEKKSKDALDEQRLKTPTRATIKSWLLDGIITPTLWVDYMRSLKYPDETITLYLQEIMLEATE